MITKINDYLLRIYFVFWGVFYVFGYFVALIEYAANKLGLNLIGTFSLLFYGLLFLVIAISLIKKKNNRYLYAMIALFFVWFSNTIHHFIFINNFHLDSTDLINTLLFGIPFMVSAYNYKLLHLRPSR